MQLLQLKKGGTQLQTRGSVQTDDAPGDATNSEHSMLLRHHHLPGESIL